MALTVSSQIYDRVKSGKAMAGAASTINDRAMPLVQKHAAHVVANKVLSDYFRGVRPSVVETFSATLFPGMELYIDHRADGYTEFQIVNLQGPGKGDDTIVDQGSTLAPMLGEKWAGIVKELVAYHVCEHMKMMKFVPEPDSDSDDDEAESAGGDDE